MSALGAPRAITEVIPRAIAGALTGIMPGPAVAAGAVGIGATAAAGVGTYKGLVAIGTTDGERRAIDGIKDPDLKHGDNSIGSGISHAAFPGGFVMGIAGVYGGAGAAIGTDYFKAGRSGAALGMIALGGAGIGSGIGWIAGSIAGIHASDRIADAAR